MEPVKNILSFALALILAAACTRSGMDSQNDTSEDDKNSRVTTEDKDTASVKGGDVSQAANAEGKRDADFVLAAIDGGLLEVRLGQLAMKQASSPDVKSFGKSMTIDHGKANDELTNLASKLNISTPDNLSEKSQQKYDDLSQKKGADFDKAYSKIMVEDHQETIEKFQTEAANGQLTEIRDWAGAKVPTLQHHLTMAQKMEDSLNTPGQ